MTDQERIDKAKQEAITLDAWQRDVFLFAYEALGMKPSEPIDSLRGRPIEYTDGYGNKREALLFTEDGQLAYHDLGFYKMEMFKNQDKPIFKLYRGRRFTWQQTITLTAYQRALSTFDKDSFDQMLRYISIVSGHGTGKTASECVVALHFLICFAGAQIGVTAITEQQLKDIFLKELYYWRAKLPEGLKDQIEILDDLVRIVGDKDWFIRARVARPEKPEALAGLHGKYVLIIVDEASGVPDKVFEVMKGSLTGENYIVLYCSNGTRTEGEFFESHKKGSAFTRLAYSSRQSPIVKDGYISRMEEEYGADSDEVRIRVDGKFAHIGDMDEKGWIPLFANVRVMFEPERGQIIRHPVIGVDPAGKGRDKSLVEARDAIYLKILLDEKTSTPKDLARKIETLRDAYQAKSDDIGIGAFGIGAEVVANIETKMGETVHALLTDKPREETKHLYANFKAELAWKFRNWLAQGGIIITNRQADWMRELEKIKYKRDGQGRIVLMGKVEFKKEYGFSPDRFDAAIHTFFRDHGTQPVVLTKQELENKDMMEWVSRTRATPTTGEAGRTYSSM